MSCAELPETGRSPFTPITSASHIPSRTEVKRNKTQGGQNLKQSSASCRGHGPAHVSPRAHVHTQHLILCPAYWEKPLNGAARTRQPSVPPPAAAPVPLLWPTTSPQKFQSKTWLWFCHVQTFPSLLFFFRIKSGEWVVEQMYSLQNYASGGALSPNMNNLCPRSIYIYTFILLYFTAPVLFILVLL